MAVIGLILCACIYNVMLDHTHGKYKSSEDWKKKKNFLSICSGLLALTPSAPCLFPSVEGLMVSGISFVIGGIMYLHWRREIKVSSRYLNIYN